MGMQGMPVFSIMPLNGLLTTYLMHVAFGYPEGPPVIFAPGTANEKDNGDEQKGVYSKQYATPSGLYVGPTLDPKSSLVAEPSMASEALIVEGQAEGFLNLTSLPPEEKDCIERGSLPLATTLIGAGKQIVVTARTLAAGNVSRGDKKQDELLDDLSSGMRRMLFAVRDATRSCSLGIELRGLIGNAPSGLVNLAGDELHIRGVIVGPQLHEAAASWVSQDPRGFGQLIGRIWRKVLLSETLTEGAGPPSDEAVWGMSSGLVEGFFGGNSFDGVSSAPRDSSDRTDKEFRQCVNHNLPFFEVVWSATTLVFKEMAERNTSSISSQKEDADLRTSLAQALVRFPSALRRCGVQNKEEFALVDALEALGRMHFTIDRSSYNVHTVDVSVDLSEFIRDWKEHHWRKMGLRLGKLLQQMVVAMFPLKYSSDISGRLQHIAANVQTHKAASSSLVCISVSAFAALIVMVSMVKFCRRPSPNAFERLENPSNSQFSPSKQKCSDLEEAIE